MKQGTRVRFQYVRYNEDLQAAERTDKVLEGTVLWEHENALTVKVDGYQHPYYVEKSDVVEHYE